MTIILRKRGAVTAFFPRKHEFIRKVRECQELARQKFPEFNLTDEQLPIVFVAKGRNAGMARWKRNFDGSMTYNVEFNIEAITNHWDDMTEDTIAHEMAHIVDFVIHGKNNGHNLLWKRIARKLGCSGERTHNYEVTKARRTTKHIYVASCGTEVKLGTQRHNKVRRGSMYIVSRTGGTIATQHYTGRVVVG